MEGTTDITDIVFSENNEEREEGKAEESVDAKESSGEEEKEKNSINTLSNKLVGDGSDDSTSAEAKNGGVLNNLISSILHPNGVGDERERSAAADERERGGDTDDGDAGGGGLMDNLASHLPDDAAPDTEEASMLIHSVVRD